MAPPLLDILGKPQTLIRHVEDRPCHNRRYALDAGKIESEIGWKPTVSLEEGLLATITWYRNHRGWWEANQTGRVSKLLRLLVWKTVRERFDQQGVTKGCEISPFKAEFIAVPRSKEARPKVL